MVLIYLFYFIFLSHALIAFLVQRRLLSEKRDQKLVVRIFVQKTKWILF